MTIFNCNTSFAAKLGYLKNELVDLSLGSICPWLDGKTMMQSTRVIERSLSTLVKESARGSQESLKRLFRVTKTSNKNVKKGEILVFVKKNKFLVSFVTDIKYCEDFDKNQYLVVLANIEKYVKPVGSLLISNKSIIVGVSSTVAPVFGVSVPKLKELQYKRAGLLFSGMNFDIRKVFSLDPKKTIKYEKNTFARKKLLATNHMPRPSIPRSQIIALSQLNTRIYHSPEVPEREDQIIH